MRGEKQKKVSRTNARRNKDIATISLVNARPTFKTLYI